MTPELITTIIAALIGGGITGFLTALVSLSKLPVEKTAVNVATAISLIDELQQERETLTKELRSLRGEIECLYAGQKKLQIANDEKDEIISGLTARVEQFQRDVVRLEGENADLRQQLNEYKLEVEQWRAGRRSRRSGDEC